MMGLDRVVFVKDVLVEFLPKNFIEYYRVTVVCALGGKGKNEAPIFLYSSAKKK